ncbi:MAG TPA: YidC/Oxa1 family membrane protein insertase [Dongiaceae bacterium]|nr:YidC/Oxa1 family membrane protein insertase [Dongiaceae bacterium]
MNIFELIVVQPIFNLLLAIYSFVPFADFGIAVIIFTVVVRFALWPLVVKQLHQVKAMRKLQPELKRIKKATKGNRQLESMQMLELYKKHEVKPFRSILILLIQLPIFIALFRVIQIFTTHRDEIAHYAYGFMQNLGPVKEIIKNPDSFNKMFLGFIDITSHAIQSGGVNIFLFILAIVAAYTQYIVSKQTSPQTTNKRLRDVLAEAGEGKQPDQSELNAVMTSKMMKFLPFMMFFIMLSLPGALALYYVTSNLFAAIQQHFLLKRDAEEMDKLAAAEPKQTGKKATARARAREAREAETVVSKETITRISAKDTPRKSKEDA